MELPKDKLHEQIAERLKQLPQVVRDSITSADIEKHLRKLANIHQLHIDQWEILENEVMFTLLGFQKTEDFEKNIRNTVEVTPEVAHLLAQDISAIVFAPIREELERILDHPDAHDVMMNDVDTMRTNALTQNDDVLQTPTKSFLPIIIPATPPTPLPTEKAIRVNISPSYAPQTPSHERKAIEGDPYRMQVE